MTDRERLLEIFKDKILYKDCENGDLEVHDGYVGFFTIFEFNSDGSLKRIQAGE